MSRNPEIAELLEEFANLLDAKDVEYKPQSYRRAAENILDYPVAIEELADEGVETVKEIEGVGDAIASKVVEYFETGRIVELDELRSELPVNMAELTAVEGVGPKSVGKLYEALEITSLDDLEAAAAANEIQDVAGFGKKTEANIRENIPFAKEASKRELLGHGRPVADELLTYLSSHDAVSKSSVAGSIRRWKPTIGDIDILVASSTPADAIECFTDWERVESVVQSGETKASIRARGIQIDLRVVQIDEFGSALQYFTGSRDHNVGLRQRAIDRGLKMNEYGVFDVSHLAESAAKSDQRAGKRIAGVTEAEMYDAVDLPVIPPELRQDSGEIDAAAAESLPTLIESSAIRGDLHTHTEWSDGNGTIEEMADAAQSHGYDYLAICDHATGPGMVGGVGIADDVLLDQYDEIEAIRADLDITLLAGVEANIDESGQISVADSVLEALDIVVASPHNALDQSGEEATDRLIRAISHPAVTILGHPTGRLLNRRAGLDFAIEEVAEAAAEHDTALEVNAHPQRLDLDGTLVRVARNNGARIAINTDAHSQTELGNIRYGLHTARRGWAEADDVINAWDFSDLQDFIG